MAPGNISFKPFPTNISKQSDPIDLFYGSSSGPSRSVTGAVQETLSSQYEGYSFVPLKGLTDRESTQLNTGRSLVEFYERKIVEATENRSHWLSQAAALRGELRVLEQTLGDHPRTKDNPRVVSLRCQVQRLERCANRAEMTIAALKKKQEEARTLRDTLALRTPSGCRRALEESRAKLVRMDQDWPVEKKEAEGKIAQKEKEIKACEKSLLAALKKAPQRVPDLESELKGLQADKDFLERSIRTGEQTYAQSRATLVRAIERLEALQIRLVQSPEGPKETPRFADLPRTKHGEIPSVLAAHIHLDDPRGGHSQPPLSLEELRYRYGVDDVIVARQDGTSLPSSQEFEPNSESSGIIAATEPKPRIYKKGEAGSLMPSISFWGVNEQERKALGIQGGIPLAQTRPLVEKAGGIVVYHPLQPSSLKRPRSPQALSLPLPPEEAAHIHAIAVDLSPEGANVEDVLSQIGNNFYRRGYFPALVSHSMKGPSPTYTVALGNNKSQDSVMEAIRQGKTYLTRNPRIVFEDFAIDKKHGLGSKATLPANSSHKVHLACKHLKPGSKIVILQDGNPISEEVVSAEGTYNRSTPFKVSEGKGFGYLEVKIYGPDGRLGMWTSPLHYGVQPSSASRVPYSLSAFKKDIQAALEKNGVLDPPEIQVIQGKTQKSLLPFSYSEARSAVALLCSSAKRRTKQDTSEEALITVLNRARYQKTESEAERLLQEALSGKASVDLSRLPPLPDPLSSYQSGRLISLADQLHRAGLILTDAPESLSRFKKQIALHTPASNRVGDVREGFFALLNRQNSSQVQGFLNFVRWNEVTRSEMQMLYGLFTLYSPHLSFSTRRTIQRFLVQTPYVNDPLIGELRGGPLAKDPSPMKLDRKEVHFSSTGPIDAISHASQIAEAIQGKAGDCYYLAAGLALAEALGPNILNDRMYINGDGSLETEFFQNGKPRYVLTDAKLPRDSTGELVYARENLMFALHEKSYALWHQGSYEKIGQGGFAADALHEITGWPTEDVENVGNYNFMESQNGRVFVLSSRLDSEIHQKVKALGSKKAREWEQYLGKYELVYRRDVKKYVKSYTGDLVGEHAYVFKRVETDEEGKRWMVVRNPWRKQNRRIPFELAQLMFESGARFSSPRYEQQYKARIEERRNQQFLI